MMRAYIPFPNIVGTRILAMGAIIAAWLACQSALAAPFANYLRFVRTGPTTLDALFDPGPHPAEFGLPAPLDPPLPGWDANVMASVVTAGGPPVLDENTLLLHVPVNNTFTLHARDSMGNALGTLTMLAVGSFPIDFNADNAIVDETAGTIQVQLGGTLLQGQPAGIFSVEQATGIYATDVLVGESFGYQGGYWLFPLDDDPNTSLQQNILNAWDARQRIGEEIRAVITGNYVPEPSAIAMGLVSVLAVCVRYRPRRLFPLTSRGHGMVARDPQMGEARLSVADSSGPRCHPVICVSSVGTRQQSTERDGCRRPPLAQYQRHNERLQHLAR